MMICFHLPTTEDIAFIDIAPGGYDEYPQNTPGGVRIDCYHPAAQSWFNVYAQQTLKNAISGDDEYNNRLFVWSVGQYLRFPLVNNSELYQVNHVKKIEICAT